MGARHRGRALALAGTRVVERTFDTVREASGRSEEEAVAALEELTGQGLVEEVKGAEQRTLAYYDFSHEKLRALIYEETSLARRRLMHRRVAEALARRSRRRRERAALVGQIAHHYRLAGRDAEAADFFKLAGDHARTLYANAEALSHFRAALALGHPDAAGLHESMGDLQTLLGEYGQALASYEAAAALDNNGNHLANLLHAASRQEESMAHLKRAVEIFADLGEEGELQPEIWKLVEW